ncbi:hypothetical protein LTR10_013756 [Elasticomyces elasticus]|uniref:AMP-dependent synthetase/ligase domain-containing protein n=1 Tax=Exophiala sideris TaxID=1016849 RepID=A0ABR0JH32_9EURO|nr:hypothetical protein LTR10_013756 [Elasticomyces elasticus]KAK5033268.1 hypothetical protein LTS07_003569 [Exophiala sideris]KAK5042235.1 hypothetical protein LTR13_002041 [Exophiala sideris]KAK5063812.1 hypothetical protein LTR69_003577 [Exophiala sideris]KAK5185503.1 hypothetical protein LTR44_002492 [Eurotiomycetes sp. CCFEE 6388]
MSFSLAPWKNSSEENVSKHDWTASKSVVIPSTDILTFAFANLGQYDKDKPVFINAKNPSESISASQAYRVVCQLVKGLKALGIKEGDCVCLHSYNNIWYPIIWLAIIGCGACVSGVNPAYTSSELDRHFKLTKPEFIFAQTNCVKPIIEAASNCAIPTSNIFLIGEEGDAPVEGCRYWRTLLVESSDEPEPPFHPQGGDSLAAYAMTSGTTGLPKVAMIPHRYIVAQAAILEDQFNARPYQVSQLICLPVFHAFASPLALVLPLRLGVPTYFLPKFHLWDFLQAVKKFAITDTPIVPPIAGLLAHLSHADSYLIRSLRYVICAGAALNSVVQTTLTKRLSLGVVVAQCWGTTEAGWHTLHGWSEKNDSGTVGRLLPNMELKLIDNNGQSIEKYNVVGEAYIRSPTMFSSYLSESDANQDIFDSDGFYRTGDLVLVRDDKKVVYAGRCKEILKVNGWQVSPTEVESVLVDHPLIDDAAVYGVSCEDRHGTYQTILCAYVVKASVGDVDIAGEVSEEEITRAAEGLTQEVVKAFVASRLITYKHLKEVKFVKHIPRSPTGKILRSQLGIVEPAE